MDRNKYEILLDLAETGNMTRTAEKYGYSQPGISHILKNMEKELGFPMVIRGKHGVQLTQGAQSLLPRIREVMAANEKLEQTIYSIKGLEFGKVTIGTYSSVAIHLLPKLLRDFRREHPNLEIDIREGGADNIIEWIQNGIVDFAYLSRPYTSKMEFFPYGKDRLVAALPLDYQVIDEEGFDMEQFENKPFIISAAGNDIDIHNALKCSGITPNFHFSVLDDYTIMSMVENHLGISILTELIAAGQEHRIKLIPIRPAYFRELGIGMKSFEKLSPAAKTFVRFSEQNISSIFNNLCIMNKEN